MGLKNPEVPSPPFTLNFTDSSSNLQRGGLVSDEFNDAYTNTAATSQMINEMASSGIDSSITKMVGWNAVPSGFEPLERSIGQRKRAYQFSNFSGGLNKKTSARDISLSECTKAENVSFSNQGRITVLGDAKLETGSTNMTNNSANATGYGAFAFNSAYSLASTPVKGNYNIIARGGVTAGNNIVFSDGSNTNTLDLGTGGDDNLTDVSPSIYAQASGIYACDANFLNLHNTPQALVLVDREDINNGTVPITKWVTGKPLINSPTIAAKDANTASAVTNHVETGVAYSAGSAGTADGQVTIFIQDTGTGGWGLADTSESFTFYASWLFDGITETALSTINSSALACAGDELTCNIAFSHTASLPAGGDARINGMRIYYSKASDNNGKKFFLMEASWQEGVKRSTDVQFTPWADSGTNNANGADIYDLASDMVISNPPDFEDYVDNNGYFEDEVYDIAGNTSDISAFPVKYKTSTIGADGKVYIANVSYADKDVMMFSSPGRPSCFPSLNTYPSPSFDGGAITALESFSDKIVQFRENSVTIVNVSTEKFYVQDVFNYIGVANPCQVCRVPFGIAWVNSEGCYLYDGRSAISLTHGKFKESDWGLADDSVVAGYELDRATNTSTATAGDASKTPSIGYDPRSKRLVVFKNIEKDDDGTDNGDDAFIYDFMTQSWSEAQDIITKTSAQAISNFVIYKGNLSFWRENSAIIQNYSSTPSTTQTIGKRNPRDGKTL